MLNQSTYERCQECATPITQEGCLPGGSKRKYCSSQCSSRAAYKRWRARISGKVAVGACRECGGMLPISYPNRKYCSERCRNNCATRLSRCQWAEHKHLCRLCSISMYYVGRRHSYCSLACRKGAKKAGMRLSFNPRCKACGVPLWSTNTTGYCWGNLACRHKGEKIRSNRTRPASATVTCRICGKVELQGWHRAAAVYCRECRDSGLGKRDRAEHIRPRQALCRRARGIKPQSERSKSIQIRRCEMCLKEIGVYRQRSDRPEMTVRSARGPQVRRHCDEHAPRCRICQKITYAKKGVCSRDHGLRRARILIRCAECGEALKWIAPSLKPKKTQFCDEHKPKCEVCGRVTYSSVRVCHKIRACQNEYQRRMYHNGKHNKTVRSLLQAV